MRKFLIPLIAVLALSSTACTQAQQAKFWTVFHKAHPTFCTDHDMLWNGQDHKCETPNEFCKSKYGPTAQASEDRKTGDIGCIRLAGGIHAGEVHTMWQDGPAPQVSPPDRLDVIMMHNAKAECDRMGGKLVGVVCQDVDY